VSYEDMVKPGTFDCAAARILAGTAQGFVQEVEELQDPESMLHCFEEAQAARAATDVTRSRVFSVFMVLWFGWFLFEGRFLENRFSLDNGAGRLFKAESIALNVEHAAVGRDVEMVGTAIGAALKLEEARGTALLEIGLGKDKAWDFSLGGG